MDNYQQMVKEKMARQKEAGKADDNLFFDNAIIFDHPFEQSYIEQETFEPRKFLFYKYNKKVRTLKEPTGLCLVCRKLEIEHNE